MFFFIKAVGELLCVMTLHCHVYLRSHHRHLPFTPHTPERPARLQTAPQRRELMSAAGWKPD